MFRNAFRRSVTRAHANHLLTTQATTASHFNWVKFWMIAAAITVVLVVFVIGVVNPILERDLYRQSKDNGFDPIAGAAPRTWIGEPLLKMQYGIRINTKGYHWQGPALVTIEGKRYWWMSARTHSFNSDFKQETSYLYIQNGRLVYWGKPLLDPTLADLEKTD